MLYINDELISMGDRTDGYKYADIVKDYHETVKKAQEYYGEFLNIETRIRPRKDAKTRALRYPGPRGLLLVTTMNRKMEDGAMTTEQLRYSPVILRTGDNGQVIHEDPNMLIHKGVYSFKIIDNQDLTYYILKSGKVGRTSAEGKKFYIYDAKAVNKVNSNRRRVEGQVLNLIYSSLSEDHLRILAKSFGVGEVNQKDAETVREELFTKLTDAEETKKRRPTSEARGFKEFVESSEVRFHDQITALCVDARDKGSLLYNADERRWEIDYEDGGTPYVLKELGGSEYGDPVGSLVGYLTSEPNALRKLEGVMGLAESAKPKQKKEKEPVKTDLTPEMILTEHKVPVLKKWLRQLDPDVEIKQNAKGEHIRKELLARIPVR